MHFAIDSSILATPHTGIGIYACEILNRLPVFDTNLEISYFTGTGWQQNNHHFYSNNKASQNLLKQSIKEKIKTIPGARYCWHLVKENRFKSGLSHMRPDVFWAPCFIPPHPVKPLVISVHDLSHIRYPQFHPKSRLQWMEKLPSTIEQSEKIITISEFSKREIINIFGIDQEKITVTYCAAGQQFKTLNPDCYENILSKYGLVYKSYFLSVCTLEPRKNLEILLRAYNLIPKNIQKHIPLVLVGARGWGKERHNDFYEKLCPGGNLIFTDYVPSSDLPALYNGAKVFAYPSLYEGFGIPPIEAMACGTPVIASEIDVLQEVCAEGALYAPPLDEKVWAERLIETLDLSEKDYQMHCNAGLSRSSFFSWDQTARQTYDVLQEVAHS
jgi:alpha-1,3-rhamnosyl/mannosyltransferase